MNRFLAIWGIGWRSGGAPASNGTDDGTDGQRTDAEDGTDNGMDGRTEDDDDETDTAGPSSKLPTIAARGE